MKATVRDLAWLFLGLIFLGAVFVAAYSIVPPFELIYQPWESELELQTVLLFATYRWWPVALLPVAYWWLMSPSLRSAANRVVAWIIAVSGLLFIYGWWALQQPDIMLKAIAAGQT